MIFRMNSIIFGMKLHDFIWLFDEVQSRASAAQLRSNGGLHNLDFHVPKNNCEFSKFTTEYVNIETPN